MVKAAGVAPITGPVDLVVTPVGAPDGAPDGDNRTGWLSAVDALGACVAGPFQCALGRGGITLDKREGDGATPVGRFVLRRCLYRPDRSAPPVTGLPVAQIANGDGWGDDPSAPYGYNRQTAADYGYGHEELWRDDHLYDLIVIPGHNDDPPIPGLGSAIFVHLARPGFAPTEGCVALMADDLRRVMALCGPASSLVVRPVS